MSAEGAGDSVGVGGIGTQRAIAARASTRTRVVV